MSKEVFDEIRGIWVAATPEEIVRQKLLQKMTKELFYPKELLSIEKSLSELCKIEAPLRRVDITCFAKDLQGDLYPLLVIECKEHKSYLQPAIEQILGYNHFLKAPFVAVSYPEGEQFGFKTEKGLSFLPYLPSYPDLVKAVFA